MGHHCMIIPTTSHPSAMMTRLDFSPGGGSMHLKPFAHLRLAGLNVYSHVCR
jgi:hypothetical protein